MHLETEFIFPKNKKVKYNRYSEIISTGSYFPEKIVSNEDIIKRGNLQISDNVIRRTIGVKNRREVEKGIADSDILLNAALNCLQKVNVKPEQLSKLLVTKFLGDRILPMTASMVQRKLGSDLAFHAIDIDGGINSFLNAVNLGTRYISTSYEEDQFILILSGGINRMVSSKVDPRIAFLFGDGAGAVLLKVSPKKHFLASYEYTNWNHYDYAGSRDLKFNEEVSHAIFVKGKYELLSDLYTIKNWKTFKEFYSKALIHTKNSLLEQSNLTFDEIDLFLITENNKQMFDFVLEILNIPQNKTMSLISEYGNTMSAMLPILIDNAYNSGILNEGMNIMLLSYGEGISGGGLIYKI